jgi:DNA (cytosine-5)-methyltransferase 1
VTAPLLGPGRALRLLDLFCGAGGAGWGYAQAGFYVLGVDIEPQPDYPFDFVRADALTVDLDGFDAIHASPPCQLFTVYRNNHAQRYRPALNHIPATRERLEAAGVPYVIENVPRAPLIDPVQYCGTSFPPLEVRRHRLFESNVPLVAPPCDHGRLTERKYPGGTDRPNGRTVCNIGEYRVPLEAQRRAIGIPWMTLPEIAQAVPPAYTEHIGQQLRAHILKEAA